MSVCTWVGGGIISSALEPTDHRRQHFLHPSAARTCDCPACLVPARHRQPLARSHHPSHPPPPTPQATGSLRINGRSVGIPDLQSVVGFVPQEDLVHEDLTVRENLVYSARLRLSTSKPRQEQMDIVDDVLDVLQLRHVQHQIVGSVERRGIRRAVVVGGGGLSMGVEYPLGIRVKAWAGHRGSLVQDGLARCMAGRALWWREWQRLDRPGMKLALQHCSVSSAAGSPVLA